MAMADNSATSSRGGGLTKDERFVILASSTGTIFEWYDFYLYATLAPFFAALFFPPGNETAALLSAFATYAAGFLVRPFGALFFGRIGDLVGRKYTFLVTVLVMGLATFGVGLLPTYSTIGFAAPVLLLILRLLQGLALGGEYGGAATYVAEHARTGRRGYATSWIQTTATLGFFLSLLVIGVSRLSLPTAVFADWGWRIPFLISVLLLGYSIWVRLKLHESPIFAKMKAEGKGSSSPLRDSFMKYPNNKLVLLALLGATAGQGVVWYTGQFYALFFLNITQQVDYVTTYMLVGAALLLGTPFFVVFGSLSDRIGRLYIILAGCLIAALTYFFLFGALAQAVNPSLFAYQQKAEIHVAADPANCHFNVFVLPNTVFGDCDRGKDLLTKAGLSFTSDSLPAGSPATLTINGTTITGFTAASWSKALLDSGYPNLKAAPSTIPLTADDVTAITAADVKPADVMAALNKARVAADPAAKKLATVTLVEPVVAGATSANVTEYTQKTADTSQINYPIAILVLWIMVIFVTMVYGPIAAYLVELFPTRIRYTSMSLPYHIGNGWFGGLLPLVATAMVATAGNIYFGLWFPIVVALMSVVIGGLFLRDTKGRDIDADV